MTSQTTETPASEYVHQTIPTRYISQKRLKEYLDSIHGAKNYKLEIRRGVFHLYAPCRLTQDQEAVLKVATAQGSDLSLPGTPQQLPQDTAHVKADAAQNSVDVAPAAEKISAFVRLRRHIHMNFGERAWSQLRGLTRKKVDHTLPV